MAGFEFRVATPRGYAPSTETVARARRRSQQTGGTFVLETEAEARNEAFADFTVDARPIQRASPSAIFLHGIPAHRGQEVTDEVIDGSASRVWLQAANRLHTETALLYAVLTGDFSAKWTREPQSAIC